MQAFWTLMQRGKAYYPQMALAVLINTLTIGSAIALMGTSSWLITMAGFHPSIAELQVAIVGVRFFGISRGVFRYLERLVSHAVNFRILTGLRVWFFSRFEASYPNQEWQVEQGDLVNRVLDDIDTLENLYVRVISPAAAAGVITLATSIFLATFHPLLGLVLFLGLSISGLVVPVITYLIVQRLGTIIQQKKGAYRGYLNRMMQGAEEILVYQQESRILRQAERMSQTIRKAEDRLDTVSEWITLMNYLLLQTTFVLTLILATQIAASGGLNAVLIPVSAMIVLASFEATQPLGVAAVQLGKVREAILRLEQVTSPIPAVSSGTIALQQAIQEIRVDRVNFTYPSASLPALEDITFSVRKGRRVAIVGPSGSGKSTVLQLIQALRPPEQGTIWIDAHELTLLEPDHFRNHLAVVGQTPYLFQRTLRHNLTFGNPFISDERILELLDQVALMPWYAQLTQGLDSLLHEFAANTSAGEKQRLSIVRALLKPADFLLLDEPTANLDAEIEDRVMNLILSEQEPRGMIWVTHRLKYLNRFHEILFLQDGRITERGPEEQLISNGGAYWRFWQRQNEYLH